MLTFVSLFLGLIAGVHPVEVLPAEEIARVEIVLDGETVGTLTEAPWSLPCDFGDLAPHELVAVGYDAADQEVARVRQWVNLPRDLAEAGLVLEGGEAAQLTWQSLYDTRPSAIVATLDGEPIPAQGLHRVPLPDHDPRQIHFLRVEVDFPSGLSAVAEAVFGGVHADQVRTELTAVPVVAAGRGKVPPAEQLQGGFVLRQGKAETPLQVVAVEAGGGEVVIVADPWAGKDLYELTQRLARSAAAGRFDQQGSVAPSQSSPFSLLDNDHRLRLLYPYPQEAERDQHVLRLFPQSDAFSPGDSWELWSLLGRREPPAGTSRLAEAVAVAGLVAASRDHRRAVVLILGETLAPDPSPLNPIAVRSYLQRLRVPLFVWSTEGHGETIWGPTYALTSKPQVTSAVRALEKELKRQRIVWVEGRHPPHRIRLTPEAGVAEAGVLP